MGSQAHLTAEDRRLLGALRDHHSAHATARALGIPVTELGDHLARLRALLGVTSTAAVLNHAADHDQDGYDCCDGDETPAAS